MISAELLRLSPMPIYVPGYRDLTEPPFPTIPRAEVDESGRSKVDLDWYQAVHLLPVFRAQITETPTQRGAVYNRYVEHTLPWHQDQSLGEDEARIIVGWRGRGPLCFAHDGATLLLEMRAGDAVMWGHNAQRWAHGGYVGTRDSIAIRFRCT